MQHSDALAQEVESIREEYRRRSVAPQCTDSYSFFNPAHAYLVLERERTILRALGRRLTVPLGEAEILDVGSGSGVSLSFLASYGAEPTRLHGVDIDPDRIARGRSLYPNFHLRSSDGVSLPFDDDSFDVVQQVTMLSSVHSDELRRAIAQEMMRVVRPGGLILSFDVASVGLAPRVLNRLLSRLSRKPRVEVSERSSASGPVELRPVRPVDEAELHSLFAPARPLEATRLTPYRPLVERFVHMPSILGFLSARPFATALLYVAAAPTD